MKLIYRYIFLSVLSASLSAVGLFVFVLLTGNLLREVVGLLAAGQLTIGMFTRFLLLLIPYVFSYALPLGILTGILIVLGRMSAHREVVSLKASGLSLWNISSPIFVLAVMGVALAVVINNHFAPNAKNRYRTMLTEVVRDHPLRFIEARRFIKRFPGYVLYLGSKNGSEFKDLSVWELDDQHRVVNYLRAVRGSFFYQVNGARLILSLLDGTYERRDGDPDNLQQVRITVSFDEMRIHLPLDRVLESGHRYTSLSAQNLKQLLRAKDQLESQLRRAEGGDRATALLRREHMRVRLQMQKNFAMAFSVLSLALIGIPLGIRVGRRETYANFGLALILAFVYYFLVIAVSWLDRQPDLRPDLLVWLPNLVFQGVGIWLLAQANRH